MEHFNVRQPFLRLIIGPMRAEKSTSAIRIARKYSYFCNVMVVNSAIDTRSKDSVILTHSGQIFPCITVRHLKELEELDEFSEATVVVIDEGQFFEDLHEHVEKYCDEKSYVVASLDGDYRQQQFGQVWSLIPLCDRVDKLTALCQICRDGTPAVCTKAQREINGQVEIDAVNGAVFISVCRRHRK